MSGSDLLLGLTEEQILLKDAVAGFLRGRYDIEARRAASAVDGWRPEIWSAFAEELGILGAATPEAAGGLGGGAVEAGVIMEEMGRALVLEPYVETAVMAAGLLSRTGGAHNLLDQLLAGHAVVVPALLEGAGADPSVVATTAAPNGDNWRLNGAKAVVLAAPHATHLLVSARDGDDVGLFIVEASAPGMTLTPLRTIDGRRAADLCLSDVPALRLGAGDALPEIERALDAGVAALCAEAVGVMRVLLESTVEYAKQRRQFGKPIAEFQVLQHRMVDMMMAVDQSASMSGMAALSFEGDVATRARAVSAAKVIVGKACRFVAQSAVQIHGGVGVTDELALGLYFKRATVIEGQLGSVDFHLRRYQRYADFVTVAA